MTYDGRIGEEENIVAAFCNFGANIIGLTENLQISFCT